MGRKKYESNDTFIWSVIIVILAISAGTFLHDPVLHGIAAMINGWTVDEYRVGLMTGSTSVIAPVNASWQAYWFFFMFPPLAIFVLVALITFIYPNRLVMVAGIILMSLNLPSLNPEITGSDASNTVAILIQKGFPAIIANGLHYVLLFTILFVWGLYLYVAIENNSSDSRRRAENIYN